MYFCAADGTEDPGIIETLCVAAGSASPPQAKGLARDVTCRTNRKGLVVGIYLYSGDWEDHLTELNWDRKSNG